MSVFSTKKDQPTNTIFRLPVDVATKDRGLLRSEYVKDSASILYPLVAESDPVEVQSFLDAGIIGPLQARAEGVTAKKREEVYTEVIESSALEDKSPEQAIAELETLREDNPFLKAYVSPAVLAALKQSDNPTARRAAQGKLANVLIAAEILNNKLSEASTNWSDKGVGPAFKDAMPFGNLIFGDASGDFIDTMLSDLPIVSAFNVARRKELSDKFVQLLDSTEDASVLSAEFQAIVDEAADMGLLTDANRFYMSDFIDLTTEGGKGSALATQQAFAGLDILLAAGGLADAGKLIAMARGSVKETSEALMKGVLKDSPSGAVDPAYWKESLSTVGRTGPRSPVEAAAVKNVEIELQARKEALDIRLAAGSSIDDELFNALEAKMVTEAKKRAAEGGNLRYIDSDLIKDEFDNVALTEFYGTTKGRAFTSQKAAQIYADQILGEVVPVTDGSGFMVRKATNVPTGIYSQGATSNNIIDDLGLYSSLDTDELGKGFFAHFGSPLSQTDWSNNAVLKQGEFAKSKALEVIGRDVEKQIKVVGKEGKIAVEKVFSEFRDGSMAHLRESPTVAVFEDTFLKANGRTATDAEKDLYRMVLSWNDTDWFLSADMHFKRSVERGIEILIPQDGIEVGAVKITNVESGRLVWDIDSKAYVAADTLSADRKLYRLVEPMEFDGKLHDLVASAVPKTRALKHTDVMGYNAGGSRLYAPNRTNFIVKQETEVSLADGTVRKGTPRTLMVAKTEKEVAKAQSEINSVLSAIHAKVSPKAYHNADEYIRVVTTKHKDSELNDLIARNSGWNTDVHSVENLVEWATENNVDLRKTVQSVSDGQPLLKGDDMIGDITFKDIAVSPGPLKMGDFRKDQVLKGYGGQKVPTIAPFEAINRSLMSSVASQTEMAYSTRAIMRLFRTALEKNLIPAENIAFIRNMPVRQKARNMIIDTGTSDGKKLELERKKIISRLEKQRILDNYYHKAKDSLANVLWDKGQKGASEKIDSLSADPVAGARGIVFDAYLGAGAIDQLYVQASQISSIVAMANKTDGVLAASVAPYFRLTVANGHKAPSEVMAKLSSGVLGITPEQFLTMIDTWKASGKGYVQGSIADLGSDSAGKVAFRKVREAGRIPYTEGETLSRITAHVAASLEYLQKFGPKADLLSQHGKRWVTHQSDIFTHGMSSSSRHPIEQLPMMQFMSISMRMAEWYLSGIAGGKGVLTGKQKFKLMSFQLGLYGAAALPFAGYYLDWYNFKNGTDLTEADYYQLRHGLVDSFIQWTTGVESELGRRLAWGEGVFNTIQDLQANSPVEIALGPSYSFGKTVLESTSKLLWNMKVAGTDLLAEDTLDVFRSIKSVNLGYNAYMAMRYGVYQTRRGDTISDDLNSADAVAIALGVPLGAVNEVWRNIEMVKNDKKHHMDTAKRVAGIWQDLHDERRRNGTGTDRERVLISALETIYSIYTPYEIQQFERYVDKSVITMNEELMIEMLKREAIKGATE